MQFALIRPSLTPKPLRTHATCQQPSPSPSIFPSISSSYLIPFSTPRHAFSHTSDIPFLYLTSCTVTLLLASPSCMFLLGLCVLASLLLDCTHAICSAAGFFFPFSPWSFYLLPPLVILTPYYLVVLHLPSSLIPCIGLPLPLVFVFYYSPVSHFWPLQT